MANQCSLRYRTLPATLVSIILATSCAQTLAQAVPEPESIPEVLVTAQRTSSQASKTPVAMTAMSAEQLQQAGIDTPADLGARLPSVQLNGAADGLKITIRGVSSSDTSEKGDPSAAFMLDGIYIARPQIQNLSFFDLARVEVLRGPQGTLYGRNTTAGVVNVISQSPTRHLEGALGLELGDYSSRKLEAMLNVPVNELLALRAAVAYNKHDSYLINQQGTGYDLGLDRDDVAARVSAKLVLGEGASLLLRADRSELDNSNDSIVPVTNFYKAGPDGQPVWRAASPDVALTNAFVPFNAPLQRGFSKAVTEGLGAELEWDLGPARLSYLASQRSFKHDQALNFYYQIAPTIAIGVRETFTGDYQQDSHEVRLATKGKGPLRAQAGVYYFREESDIVASFRDLEILGLPPYYVFPQGPTKAVGKAVFSQANYSLSDRLRATVGVRYSQDDKSRLGATNFQQGPLFNPATDLHLPNQAFLRTDKTTWRLGSEFDLAPATLLYANVSTGYKAGGFNDGCLEGPGCPAMAAVPAGTLFYQPETLTAYEGGFKTRFWGGKASLNTALFYYDYSNLQLSGIAVVNGAPRFITTNAGVARVKGLEADGQVFATKDDRFSYSAALLDAHYVSYLPDGVTSWAGKKLDRSPRTALTLGYEHSFHVNDARLKAGLFSRTSGAYVISVPSQLLQYQIPSHTVSDLQLSYSPNGARWRIQALLRNLENKVVPITIDSVGQTVPSDPRTARLRFDYRF